MDKRQEVSFGKRLLLGRDILLNVNTEILQTVILLGVLCGCENWSVRFSEERRSVYVEIKCQLDGKDVFIADLIACSTCFRHHYAHQGYVSGLWAAGLQ